MRHILTVIEPDILPPAVQQSAFYQQLRNVLASRYVPCQ
jgi:hypothetical protein